MVFARDEDAWDHLTGNAEPDTWSDAIEFSAEEIARKLEDGDRKNAELAGQMWKVVLAERELAAKEEETRITMGE